MVEGDYRTESGYWATERLLEQGVTAIFACNDLMACGVYRYAVEHGIQIPKNLSVAGFDDAEFSDVLAVPLTTVRQPSFTLGRAAAERLIAQIRGETVPQEPEVFPPELKIRASACPPKSV